MQDQLKSTGLHWWACTAGNAAMLLLKYQLLLRVVLVLCVTPQYWNSAAWRFRCTFWASTE